ncbi:Uncharacterised protein [Burkholderia pseudomallei]|nr:Uncharacterised protein [Burkholderia pseudomallei]
MMWIFGAHLDNDGNGLSFAAPRRLDAAHAGFTGYRRAADYLGGDSGIPHARNDARRSRRRARRCRHSHRSSPARRRSRRAGDARMSARRAIAPFGLTRTAPCR